MPGVRSRSGSRPAAAPTRRRVLASGLGAACAVGLGLAAPALAQGPAAGMRFFRIATGTTGGTYFPVGTLLANIITKPLGSRPCERGGSCGVPGLIAVAQASEGSVENVGQIRGGGVESALMQADVAYWAYTGTGPFRDAAPMTGLRSIASLYVETIHAVVRADGGIRTLADLRGKRVAMGEAGSGTRVNALSILEAHGLRPGDLREVALRPNPAADALAAGDLDALFMTGGAPVAAVADLARRVPIRLLPLDDAASAALGARLPFLTPALVDADAYPGVDATPTLGVGALWVVEEEADEELVYGIAQALWHQRSRAILDQGHPRAASIRLDTALRGLSVPLHEGALRYYQEVRLPGVDVASRGDPPDVAPR
jgi:TRAP transporter TAXI family solute receptor